jgi:carotenoid 1,2-hydratase
MPRTGQARCLALSFGPDRGPDGGVEALTPPPVTPLPPSLWRIRRATRAEGGGATIMRTLEDTPFYARSELRTRLGGTECAAVHESLDLDRFRQRWVQLLLPFRMPRRP